MAYKPGTIVVIKRDIQSSFSAVKRGTLAKVLDSEVIHLGEELVFAGLVDLTEEPTEVVTTYYNLAIIDSNLIIACVLENDIMPADPETAKVLYGK